jgi:hypothetical protein
MVTAGIKSIDTSVAADSLAGKAAIDNLADRLRG